MTLNEVMKDTADAIREKTGKSELIAPVDFAEEIKSISAGGGESGGSTIEYLDVSGLGDTNELLRNGLVLLADVVKSRNDEGTYVGACLAGIQSLFGFSKNNVTTVVAVAVDFTRHISGKSIDGEQGSDFSIADVIVMMAEVTQEQLDAIPRLTKEQFYDLNA